MVVRRQRHVGENGVGAADIRVNPEVAFSWLNVEVSRVRQSPQVLATALRLRHPRKVRLDVRKIAVDGERLSEAAASLQSTGSQEFGLEPPAVVRVRSFRRLQEVFPALGVAEQQQLERQEPLRADDRMGGAGQLDSLLTAVPLARTRTPVVQRRRGC